MQKYRVGLKVLAVVLVLAGVLSAVAAVGSATWWRPDTQLAATTSAGSHVVTTDPGVLGMGADSVLISASGNSDEQVVLVLGRDVDVTGWLASAPHTTITGLTSKTELKTTTSSESSVELPDPAGLDMWLLEESGDGQAELSWTAVDDHVVLLAATVNADGKVVGGPAVTLTWNVPQERSWLIPGIAVGVVLLAAGIVLLIAARRRTDSITPNDEPSTDSRDDTTSQATTADEQRAAETPVWHSAPPAWQSTQPEPGDDSAASSPTWHSAPPAWQGDAPDGEVQLQEGAADSLVTEPQAQPTSTKVLEVSEKSSFAPPASVEPLASLEPPAPSASVEPPAPPAPVEPPAPSEPLTRKKLRELKLQGRLPEEFSDWGEK